jgi:hypothetical protein
MSPFPTRVHSASKTYLKLAFRYFQDTMDMTGFEMKQ